MEIRVLPSRNEVRLLVWGVHGLLPWKDLQMSASLSLRAAGEDVEFVLPLDAQPASDRATTKKSLKVAPKPPKR
jgi:hypothetical protein